MTGQESGQVKAAPFSSVRACRIVSGGARGCREEVPSQAAQTAKSSHYHTHSKAGVHEAAPDTGRARGDKLTFSDATL